MSRRQGAAFTLIELLVVIIIIGIIISITLPALGGARNAARRMAADAMMRQITNAAAVFHTDNRRMPGYFPMSRMAGTNNNMTTGGFSAMQNVMLDLSGFQIDATSATKIGPDISAPQGSGGWEAVVPGSLGSPGGGNTKSYWIADAPHSAAQNGGGQQIGVQDNQNWPSVVDNWGNPILAWVADDVAVGNVKTEAQFAQVAYPSNANATLARFYWQPNACFLSSPSFGRRASDQNAGSAIGGAANPLEIPKSLIGMLGNPSQPYKDPNLVTGNMPYAAASAPRGPLVLQSAGKDNLFVANSDAGKRQFSTSYIDYRVSFAPNPLAPMDPTTPGNIWKDKNDKPTNIDVMDKFNDIIVAGGN